ncbi:MAG TPA: hypothetical protein PKY82_04195, partial [Pyrinomonadaceae bacterium]|nr:hypothetical protein [Pyrinomonadaceae bacterium]
PAGTVCPLMGFSEYPRLAENFKFPLFVTEFEPLAFLEGIRGVVVQPKKARTKSKMLINESLLLKATKPLKRCWLTFLKPPTERGVESA